MNSSLYRPITDFTDWVQHNNIPLTGIPMREFAPLIVQVHRFSSDTAQLGTMLSSIDAKWTAVPTSIDSANVDTARSAVHDLAVWTVLAKKKLDGLEHDSGAVNASAVHLEGVVDRYKNDDAAALAKAKALIASLDRRIAKANIDIKAAQDELSGGKGFLNGFLTAVTFTAYNPVKDNLNKLQSSLTTLNASRRNEAMQEAIANQRSSQLNALTKLVAKLRSVEQTVVLCQNDMNQAIFPLRQLDSDFQQANDHSDRVKAINAFLKIARTPMARLKQWETEFNLF